MTTAWDPTTIGFKWSLSSANLTTAVTTNGVQPLSGETIGPADAAQPVHISIDIPKCVGVVVVIGLATASPIPSHDLGDYRSASVTSGGYVLYPASTPQLEYGATIPSGFGSGQTIYIRIKNGLAYFAPSRGGPWIGVTDPTANLDPALSPRTASSRSPRLRPGS